MVLVVGGTTAEYGLLQGYGHHQGLILLAFLISVWALWPHRAQLQGPSGNRRWLHHSLLLALLVTFGWHSTWSFHSIRSDWAGPYSGARDAAQFLKSVKAEKIGYTGHLYWTVGVQPYFGHNIFINYGGPESPASFHFAPDFNERAGGEMSPLAVVNGPPFIVVAPEESPQELIPRIQKVRSLNFILVHYSPGTRFFKGTLGMPALYLIFQRVGSAGTPHQP